MQKIRNILFAKFKLWGVVERVMRYTKQLLMEEIKSGD